MSRFGDPMAGTGRTTRALREHLLRLAAGHRAVYIALNEQQARYIRNMAFDLYRSEMGEHFSSFSEVAIRSIRDSIISSCVFRDWVRGRGIRRVDITFDHACFGSDDKCVRDAVDAMRYVLSDR